MTWVLGIMRVGIRAWNYFRLRYSVMAARDDEGLMK